MQTHKAVKDVGLLGLPIRIGTKADHRCKYGSPACARITPIRRGGRTNNLPSSPQVRANGRYPDRRHPGGGRLERLGRDTLGLLELINRAGHHGRGAEGAGYAGDALDVAGGGALVAAGVAAGGGALVAAGVAAIKRANISRRTKQGLDRAKADALAQSLIAAN